MAAGLLEFDWMLSAKERPWHGIGTVVAEAPTSEDAIHIAKLDWTVEQFPVVANGNEVAGYFANVRSDTNEALGVVRNRYKIVQNTEAFDFVDGIIANKHVECRYETAGSLFNGRRIFLLVKLPNKELLGDDVENYLFFTNSHDGSSALTAGITNVRVVCNNTLQMALSGAERIWRCRHTTNIEGKKQQAKEALGLAVRYMDRMDTTAQEMFKKKINEELFFRNLFEANPTALADKSKEETISRIHLIYNEKDDLQNFKGTAWGMYNAVADYISNTVPLRQTKNSNEIKLAGFFDGNKLLQASQELLMVA